MQRNVELLAGVIEPPGWAGGVIDMIWLEKDFGAVIDLGKGVVLIHKRGVKGDTLDAWRCRCPLRDSLIEGKRGKAGNHDSSPDRRAQYIWRKNVCRGDAKDEICDSHCSYSTICGRAVEDGRAFNYSGILMTTVTYLPIHRGQTIADDRTMKPRNLLDRFGMIVNILKGWHLSDLVSDWGGRMHSWR
jgi:hypothetical protein